jgi:hypothetical protein
MSSVNLIGAAGTTRINGTSGSRNGIVGGAGGNQTANNPGTGVDTTNSAYAAGGAGGAPGATGHRA